jgi:hypothetical protein
VTFRRRPVSRTCRTARPGCSMCRSTTGLAGGPRSSKVQRARPVFSQDCKRPIPVWWTTGKTPRLGRTRSSTSTGPLLVAILSATERRLSARCGTSRPSHAGCSPTVAASRISRSSSGSDAAPGATRYARSGRPSSRWSVSRFCACSLSSGPAPSDQRELLAVARGRGACSGATPMLRRPHARPRSSPAEAPVLLWLDVEARS